MQIKAASFVRTKTRIGKTFLPRQKNEVIQFKTCSSFSVVNNNKIGVSHQKILSILSIFLIQSIGQFSGYGQSNL